MKKLLLLALCAIATPVCAADYRALTLQNGIPTRIQDADSTIIGAGIKTASGDLTVTPAGQNFIIGAGKTLTFASGASVVLPAGSVSPGQMANIAAGSLLGNAGGSAAAPSALNASQVKGVLAITSSDVSGDFAESRITNLVSDLAAKAALAGADFTGNVGFPQTAALYFNGINDDNWLMGLNTGRITHSVLTGNVLDVAFGGGSPDDGLALGVSGGASIMELDGHTGIAYALHSMMIGGSVMTATVSSGGDLALVAGDVTAARLLFPALDLDAAALDLATGDCCGETYSPAFDAASLASNAASWISANSPAYLGAGDETAALLTALTGTTAFAYTNNNDGSGPGCMNPTVSGGAACNDYVPGRNIHIDVIPAVIPGAVYIGESGATTNVQGPLVTAGVTASAIANTGVTSLDGDLRFGLTDDAFNQTTYFITPYDTTGAFSGRSVTIRGGAAQASGHSGGNVAIIGGGNSDVSQTEYGNINIGISNTHNITVGQPLSSGMTTSVRGSTANLVASGASMQVGNSIANINATTIQFNASNVGGSIQLEGAVVLRGRRVDDADTSVLGDDYLIAYSSLTADRVVSYTPGLQDRHFMISNETGDAHTITITPTSGTCNGAASCAISTAYGSIHLHDNGTNLYTE